MSRQAIANKALARGLSGLRNNVLTQWRLHLSTQLGRDMPHAGCFRWRPPHNEIELTAMRAQGTGGQNVYRVSSAMHLQFYSQAWSMPPLYKERLLAL